MKVVGHYSSHGFVIFGFLIICIKFVIIINIKSLQVLSFKVIGFSLNGVSQTLSLKRVSPSGRSASILAKDQVVVAWSSLLLLLLTVLLAMSLSRRVSVSYTPVSPSNSSSNLRNLILSTQESSEFLKLCSTLAKGQAEIFSASRRCDS